MNGLQPSHEIRKLTIVLPAQVVDALRSQLRGDETITDCIKRLVVREALGGGVGVADCGSRMYGWHA
jgi:hypothetical protein